MVAAVLVSGDVVAVLDDPKPEPELSSCVTACSGHFRAQIQLDIFTSVATTIDCLDSEMTPHETCGIAVRRI